MTSPLLAAALNHLWQSTLFVVAVWMAAWALRQNRARMRYWLWTAASLKFLLPLSVLVTLGQRSGWRTVPASAEPAVSFVMQEVLAVSVGAAASPIAMSQSFSVVPWLVLIVWAIGVAAVLASWWRQWLPLRSAVRLAKPVRLDALREMADVVVMSSPVMFEPGVVGIRRPVLLLPDGIAERLTPAQFAALLAHERCHIRYRDNLVAAVHMAVQAIFWFHPLVWWIEGRMIEERERACDEEVLGLGIRARDYAEGILEVCRFSIESPLPCAAGVSGSNLRRRIEMIMRNEIGRPMTAGRKLALALVACAITAAPIAAGAVAPLMRERQSVETNQNEPIANDAPRFTVISIRPSGDNEPGMAVRPMPNRGYSARKVPLIALLTSAFGVSPQRIVGVPPWLDRYDIEARYEPVNPDAPLPSLNVLLQSMLRERFGLVAHMEKRDLPVYVLRLAGATTRLGPSLTLSKLDCGNAAAIANARQRKAVAANGAPACEAHEAPGVLKVGGMPMDLIAAALRIPAGRDVVNGTGLGGLWEASLEFALPNDTSGDKPSVFTAVQEQLGLRLESSTAPLDVVVIDAIERPSAN